MHHSAVQIVMLCHTNVIHIFRMVKQVLAQTKLVLHKTWHEMSKVIYMAWLINLSFQDTDRFNLIVTTLHEPVRNMLCNDGIYASRRTRERDAR